MTELTDEEHEAYGAMIHRGNVEAALVVAAGDYVEFQGMTLRELMDEIKRLRLRILILEG